MPPDVLVVGAGPAALAIAAALVEQGLTVEGLAAADPQDPWANTYGIWGPEVDAQGLGALLAHRWSDTRSFFGAALDAAGMEHGTAGHGAMAHGIDYGLFDKTRLQQHWLEQCRAGGLRWHRGLASTIRHGPLQSTVSTQEGQELSARLVVDASGHQPVFVQRPEDGPVAGQAAYGVVGTFSAPPVPPGQFVLMDFRCDHLTPEERLEPPTFLYAMDLGGGVFFVEETSLALAPPVAYATLQQRLRRRLAHRGVQVLEERHQEFCLFPMNLPLPDLEQQVVGFGGAASMVHPASGYMVGALLRRAPDLAAAIAAGLRTPGLDSAGVARQAWAALWPLELRRKHALYRFGLEKLMRFPEARLRAFFATFFAMPTAQWYGFLTNTLPLPQLIAAMLRLFATAPWGVRWGLLEPRGRELALLGRLLRP